MIQWANQPGKIKQQACGKSLAEDASREISGVLWATVKLKGQRTTYLPYDFTAEVNGSF